MFFVDSFKSLLGFILFWLLYGCVNEDIFLVCVIMCKRSYILSFKYIEMKSKLYIFGFEIKGFSRRGKLYDVEYDENDCFVIDFLFFFVFYG